MKLKHTIVFGFGFILQTATAIAGPFGLDMGMPVSKLSITKDLGQGRYEITVPLPNSEFESYVATATSAEGVCGISAIGKTHDADKSGFGTKISYAALKDALKEKYGASKSYDFLHAGSIWKESYEWSASIYRRERTYADFWSPDVKSTLPTEIANIALRVSAIRSDAPFIILSYEFPNMTKCNAPRTQQDKDAL